MICCMFRSRRSILVRRLWRLRCQNETGGTTETPEELELKSVVHSMLKRLKEKQLEALITSVESKGGEECDCVLLPKGEARLGKKTLAPLVMCCKMWRWPDMTNFTELKRLPCCISKNDPAYECCNPYHWSLLSEPECQISDCGWSDMERAKFTDHYGSTPEDAVSMETGMTPTARRDDGTELSPPTNGNSLGSFNTTNQSVGRGPHWCSIAYWELRQRIGRLLTVFDSHINIFQDLPHGDGISLQILQENSGEIDSVRRTREKIGFGIVLSKEADGVWVYNKAHIPVFVNSPTLEDPYSRTLYVHKLCPGYSLKIFDYERGHLMEEIRDPKYLDGPYDPSSIRISFAKGWGPNYSRQFITSCPCWLEILINSDR